MKTLDDWLNVAPTKTLYHYTDANGLIGILQNGSIWASCANHLNDTGEFQFALRVIGSQLESRIKSADGASLKKLNLVNSSLSMIAAGTQAYVASFTEEGDLLSQWLTYPRATIGYALGFRPSQLGFPAAKNFRLVKCIYGEKDQEQAANVVIDGILQGFEARSSNRLTEKELQPLTRQILAVAASIKHTGFEQEAEWRLVRTVAIAKSRGRGINFRPGRDGIVPYLNAPLVESGKQLIPTTIHIGPTDNKRVTEMALRTLLVSLGIESASSRNVNIQCSQTPYRP